VLLLGSAMLAAYSGKLAQEKTAVPEIPAAVQTN
jgi:hypothetical protein